MVVHTGSQESQRPFPLLEQKVCFNLYASSPQLHSFIDRSSKNWCAGMERRNRVVRTLSRWTNQSLVLLTLPSWWQGIGVPCGYWGWGELLTWARGSSSFFNYNTDLIGIKIIIVEDIVMTLLRLPVVGGRWAEPGSNAKQGRMLHWLCPKSVSLSA